jgi:hypothetical protein
MFEMKVTHEEYVMQQTFHNKTCEDNLDEK